MKKFNQILGLVSAAALMASSAFATPVSRSDVDGAIPSIATGTSTNTVDAVGCAAVDHCTLEEFANGATLTVNGITLSNVVLDFAFGAYELIDLADMEFYAIENIIDPFTGGFGFRGTGFPFDLIGVDVGDLDILFDLSVAAGTQMTGFAGINQVFALDDGQSSMGFEGDNGLAVDFLDDGDGILGASFDGVTNLSMTNYISNISFSDTGFVFYDGYQFGIETVTVPEPAPLLLMLLGLGWVARRRNAKK